MELTNQFFQFITKIFEEKQQAIIDKLEAKPRIYEIPYKSDDINELATALAKAQGDFSVAELNKGNPFFKSKYADFMSIVSAARPALAKNNLSVVQNIIAHHNGDTVLHTILMHSSGQYIESRMKINPPKNDIQTISSYTTYLKRLTYASLLGITTGDESDDDGEIAVSHQREVPAKRNNYQQEETFTPLVTITQDQQQQLEYELEGYPELAKKMMEKYDIDYLPDLPRKNFIEAITRTRELKELLKNRTNGASKKE